MHTHTQTRTYTHALTYTANTHLRTYTYPCMHANIFCLVRGRLRDCVTMADKHTRILNHTFIMLIRNNGDINRYLLYELFIKNFLITR